jgi:alkanesulfonate monooxygenase SsuD/methylene tetrahydromethanopterin reductase-like flavin-dependent oxidoreductase (luciferase family)
MRSLKVGLHIDIGEYPEDYHIGRPDRSRRPDRWSDLAAMAQAAERVGFDSVMVPDHLLYRIEPGKPEGAWECFSILAAFAAITTRIELAPLVACAQFRNPALTAKIADTIDEISGGRLILGLGSGSYGPELAFFGYPDDHPVGRFEEALSIIYRLLRNGYADAEGRYYTVRDCELRPRGPRSEGPPIMMGGLGTGPRMLRLTAQYADIWNLVARFDPDETDRYTFYQSRHALLDSACEIVGRDPATLARSVVDNVNPLNHPRYTTAQGIPVLCGGPADIAEALARYRDLGVEHVIVNPLPLSVEAIEAMAPVLEQLDHG